MSDSNWFERNAAKLGFLLALFVAVTAIGWGWNYGLRQERTYEQEAREAHADQAENGCYQLAESQVQVTAIKQADRKSCTPSKEAEQEKDNRRDYADLVAQRSSALWAKIMGIAALIGMGLSLIGVALVWTTFRETRKANEISRTSQRPWLDANIKLHGISKVASGYALRIEVMIENVGSIPANHIRCSVDGFFLSDVISSDPFDFGESRKSTDKAIKDAVSRIYASNDACERDGLTIFPKAKDVVFLEEVINANISDPNYTEVAWLIVGLRYFLGHKEANTIRVFIVRSFGLPNNTGFDTIGMRGETYSDTNAKIEAWERGGYAD